MLSQTPKRLVADPLVGVADLMQPVENLLQREKGINLAKYIQPPSGVSWKSAVPVEWLCKHQELLTDYINISKNTIISGKKHKLALEKLHHQHDILGGRKSTQDAVDYVDDTIRMALSHLRQMCQVVQKKDTTYRKCSPAMQETLEKLLVKIDFGPQESCTDMVPYDGDARGVVEVTKGKVDRVFRGQGAQGMIWAPQVAMLWRQGQIGTVRWRSERM